MDGIHRAALRAADRYVKQAVELTDGRLTDAECEMLRLACETLFIRGANFALEYLRSNVDKR